MIPLPKWLKDIFEKGACPHCKKSLARRGVYGIGIREDDAKKKKKTYSFCYEYRCPNCDNRTVFTGFPTNFEEFITDLLEIAKIDPPAALEDDDGDIESSEEEIDEVDLSPPKPRKSKITPTEVSDISKIMRDSEFYEDFLGKLGIFNIEREPEEDEDK